MAGQIANARALLVSYADKTKKHADSASNLKNDLKGAADQAHQLKVNIGGSSLMGRTVHIEQNFKTFIIPGCLAITAGTRVGDSNNTVAKSTAAKDQAMAVNAAITYAQELLERAVNALISASNAADNLSGKVVVAERSMRSTAATLS